jgi:peptide/nickel transport system ATP-binding protein
MSFMALVEVRSAGKKYVRKTGLKSLETWAVRDLSLTIDQGETLGIVGESGSGKTTLARMVLGLTPPSEGSIHINGVELATANHRQMKALRREMQPVFQDPFAVLNPRMRVREILAEPLRIHSSQSGRAVTEQCTDMLRAVGLDAGALHRYPHEFSGGQRQRINIARALMLRPKLLVLDEPVSALDVSVGAQVLNLLRDLQREFGLTYLFITHSMPLVRYLSTNIAVMQQGRLVELGRAEQICSAPQQEYTRALIAATHGL